MQMLHLTYAEKRRVFGRDEMRRMSPFINEIPEHLIKDTSRKVSVKPAMNRQIQTKVFQHPLSSQKSSDCGFVLGQRVQHNKFGQGTVLDHEGSGERTRVHVHFDMHGSKWLALAYAKLESVA
jgi:DNA helicase-2/ATP-dependent DNA helicase PcrA